ncbi:MAG TPA: S9 family peptidase [Tenuifilaceae bacterium]|nr:S9 family peptidase [Bacteroidales bacterium]HOA10156.1 S9 family peptidase [Tenuifilaceae bacterium]HOG72604.1 S9 family peptidase [Tenuifilaceae bacterium]HOW20718.1 S9 family peptidase [Tenuifilaceae bacterium]HPA67829.1 S9 family peptidase [Tenuifilaceae bacterium]
MAARLWNVKFYLLGLVLLNSCSLAPAPPKAEVHPYQMVTCGDTRIDPYFWLCYRDSQKVLDYLLAENAYTEAMMKSTMPLQEKLFNELKSRKKVEDVTVPAFMNGYFYYTRFEEGKEYPINCRRKGNMDAPEEVILDENEVAAGQRYCQVASLDISPNNQILAFGVDTLGKRLFTIYFKNLETGKLLPIKIDNTTGTIAWASDSQTLFYTQKDQTLRPSRIYRHKISKNANPKDELVYYEADSTFSTHVVNSKSLEYIFIFSSSGSCSEYRYLKTSTPEGKFKVFQPRMPGVEYTVEHSGNFFYIMTSWNAENNRIMETPLTSTRKESWRELVPNRSDVLVMNVDIFKDFLVATERKDALIQVKVISLRDKSQHYIDFGEEVYTALPSVNSEFNTSSFVYFYTSLTTPGVTCEYNMQTHQKKILKQNEVLGGYNPDNYETKRLWATAADGVNIPISVVYRKGIKLDGKNPLLIYGYGAYGYPVNPTFDPNLLSLLDRGFVYAIAHVRGGQELGRKWYEDGRKLCKMNTFTDFIACTECLVEQKYTSPDRIVAQGASAGGLLMGVIANLRPDLYRAIVAEVPFVDVLTTMLNPNLPLTTGEYDEWGNPNDSIVYHYIKSYSPYDGVRQQDYPSMLVLASYYDSQVQYFEPAKWVAKLRASKTDNNLLLLKTDMESGHAGSSGRYKTLKDEAFVYAFILHAVGIED